MNPYADALAALDVAKLSPAVLRLAVRLLAHVHEDNGYITVSWPDMLALCGVENKGSAWKYLGQLKAAGIIHYSTNERVDVAFEAWRTRRNERVDAPDQESGRAETGAWTRQNERVESDEKTATRRNWRVDAPKLARGRAKNDTPIGLVGRYKTLTSNDDLLLETNQPKPVLTEDQQRSRELLIDPDIGLSDAVAKRLASEHKFDWLLRQVFAWRDDIAAGRVDSAGALVNRIDRNYAPGHLCEKDRASPLYQRHVSEEAQMEEIHRRYVPDEFSDIIRS
jgi:hypothetical protein